MNEFSRLQWVVLVVTLANSALISLFPPYDFISIQRGNVPTFAGFYFALGNYNHLVVNSNFLALEMFALLANAAIAWLLLGNRPPAATRMQRWRRGVLWLVGINLIVMLLFPPFENFSAITKAVIPTFEGFYFVFGDNAQRQIVTTILYLEIALLFINAGLVMLFLKDSKQTKMSPQELNELAQRMRDRKP